MTLEQKTALIIKELFQWEGEVVSMLDNSDKEDDKAYDFDANEALDALEQFMNKYL